MGAEGGSLGHTVAPHTPPTSYEKTDAFEDNSGADPGPVTFLNPGSGISFFPNPGSEPELSQKFAVQSTGSPVPVLKFLANRLKSFFVRYRYLFNKLNKLIFNFVKFVATFWLGFLSYTGGNFF